MTDSEQIPTTNSTNLSSLGVVQREIERLSGEIEKLRSEYKQNHRQELMVQILRKRAEWYQAKDRRNRLQQIESSRQLLVANMASIQKTSCSEENDVRTMEASEISNKSVENLASSHSNVELGTMSPKSRIVKLKLRHSPYKMMSPVKYKN